MTRGLNRCASAPPESVETIPPRLKQAAIALKKLASLPLGRPREASQSRTDERKEDDMRYRMELEATAAKDWTNVRVMKTAMNKIGEHIMTAVEIAMTLRGGACRTYSLYAREPMAMVRHSSNPKAAKALRWKPYCCPRTTVIMGSALGPADMQNARSPKTANFFTGTWVLSLEDSTREMLQTGIARATTQVSAAAERTVRIPAATVARAAAVVRRIQMSDIFLDAFERVPEWDLIAALSRATSAKARPADAQKEARAMGEMSSRMATAEMSGSAYQLQAMTTEPKTNVFFHRPSCRRKRR